MLGTATSLPDFARGTVTVSVDVEDWHQLVIRKLTGSLPRCSDHVESQVSAVLDLLEQHDIAATFFVLGLVAREKPDLVRAIARRGHEIASHGVQHLPLHNLGRGDVRADLRDSRRLLSDIVGTDVVGFRAPEFSIGEKNLWVLDEIAEAGYRYDSSIFPIRHRRYGISTFPRVPTRVVGGKLWELPLGTWPTARGNLPIGGGGYFRLLPGAVIARALGSLAKRDEHAMLYFHPYEFSRAELAVPSATLPNRLSDRLRAHAWFGAQALGRRRLPGRVRRILRSSRAIRAIDLVDALDARRVSSSASTRGHDARQ